jgi:uncharacterized membrane protein YbhN (UPF0104 family)
VKELDPRRLAVRLLGLAVLIGLVAAAISSLPGLGTLRARFAHADLVLLVAIAGAKLASCLSDVVCFRDVFSPRMPWRSAYDVGMAEQATNVLLPTGGAGGLAVGAWALHDEMPAEVIARRSVSFFVLTSIPNFLVVAILGPLLLVGWAGRAPAAATAVFTGLAWGMMILVSLLPAILRRVAPERAKHGWRARLRAVATAVADGIACVRALLVPARWRALLGAMGYLGFDIGALLIGYAAFGNGFHLGPLIFAYTIGQLGGLIPVPAGIGGTDGGLIGALVLYGSPVPDAAAAVLAYRAFQLGVPAVLGLISFLRLRRAHGSEHGGASLTGTAAEPVPE